MTSVDAKRVRIVLNRIAPRTLAPTLVAKDVVLLASGGLHRPTAI